MKVERVARVLVTLDEAQDYTPDAEDWQYVVDRHLTFTGYQRVISDSSTRLEFIEWEPEEETS
ncbi:MAG: hypothetical protein F4X54_07420 [Chloroflexi bacterium]|nr:hypothetical protein [Chloroflexota bacterium]MYB84547.1 hypothetical protein [Chloroflexota bacterium]